jgi:hypothetical protein
MSGLNLSDNAKIRRGAPGNMIYEDLRGFTVIYGEIRGFTRIYGAFPLVFYLLSQLFFHFPFSIFNLFPTFARITIKQTKIN